MPAPRPVEVPKPAPLPMHIPPSVPASAPVSAPVAAPATGPAPRPGESLVVGEAYEKAVSGLMEMGFPRDQVEKAMKAAYNNPERAADYLLTVLLASLYNSITGNSRGTS